MRTSFRSVARLGLALGAALVACDGPEWHPSGSALPILEEPGLWGANDMVRQRADDPAVTVPEGRLAAGDGEPTVIYSNFDGVALTKGAENATTNTSAICGGTFKSTASVARREALQRSLQLMMNDFNVVLTLKRPTSGTYDMIVIGAPPKECPFGGGAGGVAVLDCGNLNKANIAFDFFEDGAIIVMAQEIGHTFGLSHNDVGCDVMGGGYTDKSCPGYKFGYIDETAPIIDGPGCSGATTQNSYQEMKKVLGGWPGGEHPYPTGGEAPCMEKSWPIVKINAPLDAATVMQPFEVMVDATDDCGIKNVRLEVPEDRVTADIGSPPFKWTMSSLSPGKKTIKLTATDTAGKTSAAKISITASGAGGGAKDGGAGNDGGGGNGGSGGGPRQTGGAGCSLTGSRVAGVGLALPLAVLGLALARRRSGRPTSRSTPGSRRGSGPCERHRGQTR